MATETRPTRAGEETRKSGFAGSPEPAEIQRLSRPRPGQSCPQHCPSPDDARNALGDPMTILEVAALLGCSAWTVRQRYLPRGLPYFRSCAAGKLVFFRSQVIHWILSQQSEINQPRTNRPWTNQPWTDQPIRKGARR